jgi:hypothetical protein
MTKCLRSILIAALPMALAPASVLAYDFLPQDHGLRYLGREGRTPVTVEITLRERPDNTFEYVEWVTPRSWGSWLGGEATSKRTRLEYRDDWLVVLDVNDGDGAELPPDDLAAGALDALSVRLRARGDIARGMRQAEYTVWNGGPTAETWTLEVNGSEIVQTPNGAYEALKFRLGSDTEWIEGWSAPLLIFHFAKIESWRDGRKVGEFSLDDKQL